jgi:hypothetical protein
VKRENIAWKEGEMSRKQYALTILVAACAGWLGGGMFSQFFINKPVFAEKRPQPHKIVSAEQFRVVDQDGKTRAMLGIWEGETELSLWDSNYESGISFYVLDRDGGKPILNMRSSKTDISFILQGSGDKTGLSLLDKKGETRLQLGIRDGAPFIVLVDEEGKALWSVP